MKLITGLSELVSVRFLKILTILVVLIITVFFIIESYFKNRVLDLPSIKNSTRLFIRQELNRAVDFGVFDFSLLSGVSIEDILISGTDDFSDRNILLKAEKLNIEFNGLWSGKPYIRKIFIRNATLDINIEDEVFHSLESYLQRIDAPEIEINHFTLRINKGDEEYFTPEFPLNISLRKKKDLIQFTFSENRQSFFHTNRFRGEGEYRLGGGQFNLNVVFQNAKAAAVKGIARDHYYIHDLGGKVSGKFRWSRQDDQLKMNSEIQSESLKIVFDPMSFRLNLKDFTHHFDLTRDVLKKDFVYQGDFESNRLKFKIRNQNHQIYNISFHSNNLSSIFGSLTEKEKGEEIKAEMTFSINEKIQPWILFEGGILLKDFRYVSSELNVLINQLGLSFNRSGKFQTESRGELFHQKFNLNGSGFLSIAKERKSNNEYYYPLKTDVHLEGQLEKVEFNDILPLKKSLMSFIENKISEREKKILPEEYFFYQPFYKYVLQNQKTNFLFWINEFTNNHIRQGKWKFEGQNQNSVLNAKLSSDTFSLGENQAILNLSYGIAKPTISLVSSFHLPWQGKTIQWCGEDMTSGFVELNYNYSSSGNNFMELSSSGSLRNDVILRKNVIKKSWLPVNHFDSISFAENSYGGKGNVSSIEIVGAALKLSGYGNFEKNQSTYSYYGIYQDKSVTYKIEDNGKKCTVK